MGVSDVGMDYIRQALYQMSDITGPALKNSKQASTSSFILILTGHAFRKSCFASLGPRSRRVGDRVTLLLACYRKAKYPLTMQTAELSGCILRQS